MLDQGVASPHRIRMRENLIYSNLTTADRYHPGLLKLLWGDDMTALAAIHLVEGDE